MDNTVERETPISEDKNYTAKDMLAAFKHGREYEKYESDGDIATASLPEKNRPFWGWLRIRDENTPLPN